MYPDRPPPSIVSRVWAVHALYFIVGGIWSVVGRASFEAISGPKTDYWLVRTVGGLLVAVGAVIGLAGAKRRLTTDIAWLAVGTSTVLAVIDVVYTAGNRISKVYLLDALANLVLIGGWVVASKHGPNRHRHRRV